MCSRVWRPSRATVAQPALVTGVGGSVPSTSPRPWESARGLVLRVSARCCVRSCPGAGLRAPQDSEPALPVRGAAAPCAGLVLAAPRPGQCAPRDRPVRPPLLAAEQQRLLQGPRKRLQSAAERGGLQGQPGTGTSSASLFRGEDGLRVLVLARYKALQGNHGPGRSFHARGPRQAAAILPREGRALARSSAP